MQVAKGTKFFLLPLHLVAVMLHILSIHPFRIFIPTFCQQFQSVRCDGSTHVFLHSIYLLLLLVIIQVLITETLVHLAGVTEDIHQDIDSSGTSSQN